MDNIFFNFYFFSNTWKISTLYSFILFFLSTSAGFGRSKNARGLYDELQKIERVIVTAVPYHLEKERQRRREKRIKDQLNQK